MLKHEDGPELLSPPAAQVRVTPEELAAAVAVLQANKEGMAETISIGDAVEELSLDATPEEILKAVEARRKQRSSSSRKRRRSWLALAAALVTIGAAGIVFRPHSQTAPITPAASPSINSLADVKEGRLVYVNTHGLEQIIGGEKPAQVQVHKDNQGVQWGIIKHSGRIYVQAYTTFTTEQGLKNKPADLYNSEDQVDSQGGKLWKRDAYGSAYYEAVKVTVPVQSLHYEDSQISNGNGKEKAMIRASDIHTDSHLWDGFDDRLARQADHA